MLTACWIALGTVAMYAVYGAISTFAANITTAKRSGLPYYLLPFNPWNYFGMLLRRIWVPIYKLLPRRYWEHLQPLWTSDWNYHLNHSLFEKLGDAFLVVSPRAIVLFTDNAEAIDQITSNREVFSKPLANYTVLSRWGDNVLTTEGAAWKLHRKVTAASFNEKNAALVFHESISQTQGLIAKWLRQTEAVSKTISNAEEDSKYLTLHIIAYVGFGIRLLWPGQTLSPDTDPKWVKYASFDPPAGHKLSFAESVALFLHDIFLVVIAPRSLLRVLGLRYERPRLALQAQDDFMQYMNEFLHDKADEAERGHQAQGMDIMGALVRTKYGFKATDGHVTGGSRGNNLPTLTDSEIIGNAFIMLLAGHETTATTLHSALVFLAMTPGTQRRVQKDLDGILGDSDPSTWDYDACVNRLLGSMLGACVNETLRLMPPVVDVPKKITASQDQPLMMDGKKYLLPAGLTIALNSAAVHRNPRYWPTKHSTLTDAEHNMDDFIPERWLIATEAADGRNQVPADGVRGGHFDAFSGSDTSSELFHPVRGAYLPFSLGARSCLGRRIAQVKLIAVLSVIFRSHSIELAVDDWASDEDVARMGAEQKTEVYRKAQDKARGIMRGATSVLTLGLHGHSCVPVRLVKRGDERFAG